MSCIASLPRQGNLRDRARFRADPQGGTVTFQGQATPGSTRIMRILVIVMIAGVAYWAATGGLDRIVIPDDATTSLLLSHL